MTSAAGRAAWPVPGPTAAGEYDRVGDTYLGVDNVMSTRVSTVWLGPIYRVGWFETMIFSEIEAFDDRQ